MLSLRDDQISGDNRHADFPAHASCRRRRACSFVSRRRAIHKCVLFGDSLLDAGSSSQSCRRDRIVHDESGADLGARLRAELRIQRSRLRTRAAPIMHMAERAWRCCRASADPARSRSAVPITTQIDAVPREGRRARSERAIYAIWIGGGTTSSAAARRQPGTDHAGRCPGQHGARRNAARGAARGLHAAGAQYIIVCNLPDIGKTPGGQAAVPPGRRSLPRPRGLVQYHAVRGAQRGGRPTDPLQHVCAPERGAWRIPASVGFTNATAACVHDVDAFTVHDPRTLVAPAPTNLSSSPIAMHPTTGGARDHRADRRRR